MGVLEKVTELKKQGKSEEEIISNLQAEGIPPREITDAISQAKIKEAVSSENSQMETPQNTEGNGAPMPNTQSVTDMQAPQLETPPEYTSQQVYSEVPTTEPAETYPASDQYSDYNYPQQDYGYTGTDTMIEIAEQIFAEKIKPIESSLSKNREFQTLAQTKIENISERLKKIEQTIDKLQLAILEKVGEYGSGIDAIKKEMSMMQESFNKLVNAKISKKSSSKNKKE